MKFSITRVSANRKVGPIPTTYSSAKTCPDACPLKANGCYAEGGPTAIHWRRVTTGERGMSLHELAKEIKALPKGQLWRHNVGGDLPGEGDVLHTPGLELLVAANKGKRGFTYTHKPLLHAVERRAVADAVLRGFTINLSANDLAHADELAGMGIAPVVVLLPQGAPVVSHTPQGRTVVACPAEINDNVNCSNCGVCQNANRNSIIGFRAHGTRAKRVNRIAMAEVQ